MLKIKEKIIKNISLIIIIIILIFVIGTIIYYKSTDQNILITYSNINEMPQEIRIEDRKYLNVFKKMKKDMVLEKEHYEDEYQLAYGWQYILITDESSGYYEAYYLCSDKILYVKYLIDVEHNLLTKDDNAPDKTHIVNPKTGKSLEIIPANTVVNKNGLQEMTLFKVDNKYFHYFLDLYDKLKK